MKQNKWPFPSNSERKHAMQMEIDRQNGVRVPEQSNNTTLFQPEHIRNQMNSSAQMTPVMIAECPNPLAAQALALFNQLDDRGQNTTLALLATAVKLHPKVAA